MIEELKFVYDIDKPEVEDTFYTEHSKIEEFYGYCAFWMRKYNYTEQQLLSVVDLVNTASDGPL